MIHWAFDALADEDDSANAAPDLDAAGEAGVSVPLSALAGTAAGADSP